jgi:hypothetical protein
VNFQVIALIVFMPMKLDAVSGKAARDQTLNGLIGGLAGWECSSGNGGVWHQSILFKLLTPILGKRQGSMTRAEKTCGIRAWRPLGSTAPMPG